MEETKEKVEEELPEELRPVEEEKEAAEPKKMVVTDDELVEDVDYSKDDAPVEVIYRCKKCGQILSAGAKDCWKCASTEIEEVVEEDTKEIRKVLLQSRIDKLEHDIKEVKKNMSFLYFLIAVVVIAFCVYVFTRK